MDEDYDYATAFKESDFNAVKDDINELMTTSQDWWLADFDHYESFFSGWRGIVPVHTG